MSATKVTLPQTARAGTDHPAMESRTLRGVWFGLVFSVPFWLLIAALFAVLK